MIGKGEVVLPGSHWNDLAAGDAAAAADDPINAGAAPLVAYALKKLAREEIPRVCVVGVAFFAASLKSNAQPWDPTSGTPSVRQTTREKSI